MQYATATDLITRFDAYEIAQVAVPKEHVSIDTVILQLTIDAGDRSAYSQEEQDAADATLAKINTVLTDASGEIDSHVKSGGYKLPLSTVTLKLQQVCTDIGRYLLYDDNATEHIIKRYDDAMKYLIAVAKKQISLGIDENNAEAAPSEDIVDFDGGGNVFGRDASKDYI